MESSIQRILLQVISTAFCVIVVMSNIISAKMIQMPFMPNFVIPAGLITYPLTFLLSDLVTEFYGAKKAKLMVYIALGMSLLSFGIIQLALMLPESIPGSQTAFQEVLGLSGLRIFSSLAAYLVAQIVDIQIYAKIKSWTGTRFLWLRNNGSVWISQGVDTVIIDIVYLYWGLGMSWADVAPIMALSLIYKSAFSVVNTPVLYLCVYLVKRVWDSPETLQNPIKCTA
ncbi:MAG: queuosine precursor transporter [Parachlamydiaceae bacterium]|nr:queuosine precursor transporter [Parachlamydiaceae bacterium]